MKHTDKWRACADEKLLSYATPDERTVLENIFKCKGFRAAERASDHGNGYSSQVFKRVEQRALSDGYQWSISSTEMSVEGVLTTQQEHRLVQENKALRAENKALKEENAETQKIIDLVERSTYKDANPLKIRKASSKKHQAAATAFLSDTHFDEVVTLAETSGENEYNRSIAERRLITFAEKAVLMRDLMSGYDLVHLDLPLGGDIVSGNIHEELARSNDAEIMDTVDHWSAKIAEVVVTLAKEYPTVFVPAVVGNHGRNTRKPRHKGRIRDNFDWLIYRNVMRSCSHLKNVAFSISDSTDVIWETMGHRYLMTHGDQASGGGGWGGIFSPIMRLNDKKRRAYGARNIQFDTMIIGHWHQLLYAGDVIVNGSLKGWDEFAHNLNFKPEPPQQAFWLTDPEKGKIFSSALFVDDDNREPKAA